MVKSNNPPTQPLVGFHWPASTIPKARLVAPTQCEGCSRATPFSEQTMDYDDLPQSR